jgi:hypothetical protein
LFIVALVALAFGMAAGVAAQTAPGAPAKVRAAAWPYTAVVYFTPPASDGGSAITNYTSNVKLAAATDGRSENAPQATDGPSAPTDFLLTHQGAGDAVLAWTAAVAGPSPVSHYKIYRNGVAYDKTSSTRYTDSKATNITTPGYGPQPYVPASIYKYTVSAVDTQGHEGPQQERCTAWVYHDGVDFWTLSKNSYNGGVNCNTKDTAGSPQNGAPCDIAVTVTNRANWWQPFSGQPFLHNMTPTTWAMELGAFNYMTIDLKPTVAGQTWKLNVISRVSPGDNFNSAQVILGGADRKFVPQAQPGKWATYQVPFLNASGFANGSSLQVGIGKYYGSISGTSLTVTKMVSGMNVQGSSYLSGAGIRPGTASSTGTYVLGSNATSGQAGTYAIAPAQSAANTLITAQRTNMYKFSLADLTGLSRNTYYVDNIGFTTQQGFSSAPTSESLSAFVPARGL